MMTMSRTWNQKRWAYIDQINTKQTSNNVLGKAAAASSSRYSALK